MSNGSATLPKPPKSRKNAKPPVRARKGGPGQPAQGPANWRGLLLFFASFAILIGAYYASQNAPIPREDQTINQVMALVQSQKVVPGSLVFVRDTATNLAYLDGKYRRPRSQTDATVVEAPFRAPVDLQFNPYLRSELAQAGFANIDTKIISNLWWQGFVSFLPFLLFLGVLYFFFRQQIRMAGKTAFSFGKSRARLLARNRTQRVTFKDVAGVDEAKEEVEEIVDFLKDPKKFQRLGGRIPKGVLMVGPPGTGKTLLAKAIAGEAEVPFFSISGSDFVEMFVGVGASRVRDMFEQGKRSAPCLIFIDEIDAVGRSRGTGMGGGHDEREQTLNALLVEMDGIETHEGVIVIAATNRKDVLDPALLRPGRFDREVRINLPDIKGREQILQVHVKKVKMAPTVDLNQVARGTPGFSGAELANLVNEAALLAARAGKDAITQAELEEARDKVRWGRERRSMAMSEEDKRTTAYHEAGHALLNVMLEHTDPLHKVSIIPRGPALGVTMMLPDKDKYNFRRLEIRDELCVLMGGRVAEEIFIGDVSSGASADIRQASWYAKKMICEWGMSDRLGMVHYGEEAGMVFLGRDLGAHRGYSEQTAQTIDEEVRALVEEAHTRAKDLILANRDALERITQALLEYETLDAQQVRDLINHGVMSNPPPKNIGTPTSPLPAEPLPVNPATDKKKDDGGLLPGLQGAPVGA